MNFNFALSPKAGITIAGDAGGGGSEVDYQVKVAGILGLRLCRFCVLDLGYRYLDVNKRTNAPKLFVWDAHESGALIGVTFNVK
jgi:hypothetical protein